MGWTMLLKLGSIALMVIIPELLRADVITSACGRIGLHSGTHSMEHNGITRTFSVHLPSAYDKNTPTPVVLIFHGWGGNENEYTGNSVVTDEADERGYILIAPRGLGSGEPDNRANSWSFSGSTTGLDGDGVNKGLAGDTSAICDPELTPDYSYPSCQESKANTCSWTQCQADDVEFAVALVDEIKTRLCVDSNRVFVTGGSNGGMYTWELAQNTKSAPLFRAIAPLIGLPHRGYLSAQGKDGEMPALLITGTADNVVPPGAWDDPGFTTTSNGNDRYFYTGATAITRSWADAHEGCSTAGNAVPFDTPYEEVDCRTYCADDAGWPRVLDCRADMGHSYEVQWSWKLTLGFFDAHSAHQAISK